MMKRLSLILLMVVSCICATMAQRTVEGTVLDDLGEPMIGASILAKGTSTGTVTDIDGKYSLVVPDGTTTLVVTYTGYATQEMELGASNVMDVTMAEGVTLETAVVTALGIKKDKKALGYAVSSVSGDEFAQKADSDITRLLKGKVAGVNIVSTSGVSGAGTNIVIRGYSSITGTNQPLFVVDGVPFNINTNSGGGTNEFLEGGQSSSSRFLDIDPNNIENVSVLKGLSATVIYGQQGRNGVILVTTKNGKGAAQSDKLSVTLNQSYYKTEIASLPDYQSSYGGGFHQNFGFFFSNWGPHFDTRGERGVAADGTVTNPLSRLTDPSLRSQFSEEQLAAPYLYQNYNSVENFFDDGHLLNTSINISGGNEKASFSGNFGYSDDQGFVPNNNLSKVNIGIGGNVKLSNRFTLNSSFNFVQTDYETPPISYGDGSGVFAGGGISVFSDVFYTPRSVDLLGLPFQAPVDNRPVYYRSGNDILNPRWTAQNSRNTSLVKRLYGQSSLTFDVADWLDLTYRLSIDTYTEDQEYIVNRIGLASNDYSAVNNGLYRTTAIISTTWDHNGFANFNFNQITPDIGLSGTVGFNYREDELTRDGIESTNQLVFGFIDHGNFTNYSAQNGFNNLDIQRQAKERLFAVYAQTTIDYKSYVYLNLAARNDWSSTVEEDNRSLFYPSASVSFIPTEILPKSEILDYLKVRVGYGTSAGFPGAYSTRNTLSLNPRLYVDRAGGVISSNGNAVYFEDNGAGATLGNPNLKPELHGEFEVGFDARFLKNRIGVDFTWYNKKSKDVITQAPIDPATGYSSTFVNIGEIENKGVELGLDITPVNGDIKWNIATNFYAYKSTVTDLGEIGLEEVVIEGFTNLGNFAIEGEVYGVMQGIGRQQDANGNYIIDANGYFLPDDTISIIGNPHPDFVASVTNTFSWKGISLGIQFDYRKGGDIYSGTTRALLARGLTEDTDFDRTQAFVLEGVTEEGTPNTTMINATNLFFDNYGFGSTNDVSVYDGTTVRLREISLSYSLPKSLIENTPLGGVSITFIGQNLWYKALKLPEHVNVDTDALGFGADSNGLGFEFLNGPSVRRFGASLKVQF